MIVCFLLIISLVSLLVSVVSLPLSIDLVSLSWSCSNSNRSIVIPCTVSGYVIEDLIREGIVGEPLFGMNEVLSRWVALETWTYSAMLETSNFTTITNDNQGTNLLLFEGLDTVADVFLNSKLILSAHNFHRPHLASLGSIPTTGKLEIVIRSSLAYSQWLADRHPYPIPSNIAPGAFPHFSFLRKPASDWGWDWGPAIAPSGIHSPIKLIHLIEPMLRGAMVHQDLHLDGEGHADRAVVMVEVEFWVPWSTSAGGFSGNLSIEVSKSNGSTVATGSRSTSFSPLPSSPRSPAECQDDCVLGSLQRFVTVEIEIEPRHIDLWWPLGYGSQPLYRVLIAYCPADLQGECDSIERKIGFRTIYLVTDPVDWEHQEGSDGEGGGETFYFRVNEVNVFAKGANLIPLEVIHTRATPRGLEHLIDAARDQHLNMVRVWGGGRYQDNSLYNLCDEWGILIWQEVMAACNPYPTTESSMIPDELVKEVRYQIRRLSSHPSIIIWGGNNEVEASFDWFSETKTSPRPFVASYQSLFVDKLAEVFKELDPGRRYLDGSPSNMIIRDEQRVKRWGDPQSPLYGDIHFYDYTNDCMDVKTYPKARFISEFGFQSMPSFESLKPYASDQDLNDGPFGDFVRSRQRHENGDDQMLAQLQRHFKLPDSFTGRAGLVKWIYFTQVQQALCYETALSYWRRLGGSSSKTGGVLYWQLNDIWPGQSWSSLNYEPYGMMPRRKPVHYMVKKAFSPLALTTELEASTLSIFATLDYPSPIHMTLHIRPLHLFVNNTCHTSNTSARGLVIVVDLPPRDQGRLVFKGQLSAILANDDPSLPPCTRISCYIDIIAYHPGPSSTARAESSNTGVDRSLLQLSSLDRFETQVWLAPFKELQLPPSSVQLGSFKRRSEDEVCFKASTGNSATLLIVLEHTGSLEGSFSNNLFTLEPCGSKSICFKGRSRQGPFNEEVLKSNISYMALNIDRDKHLV